LSESERAELVRLRRENTELKMDRAFLKKSESGVPAREVCSEVRGGEHPRDVGVAASEIQWIRISETTTG
jgi:hypothetical protein